MSIEKKVDMVSRDVPRKVGMWFPALWRAHMYCISNQASVIEVRTKPEPTGA